MEAKESKLDAATMGGPGLDGYAYCADVYCVACGEAICEELDRAGKLADPDTDWTSFCDSDCQPQPIFFGESPDCEQYCGECGAYMYGEDSEEDGE